MSLVFPCEKKLNSQRNRKMYSLNMTLPTHFSFHVSSSIQNVFTRYSEENNLQVAEDLPLHLPLSPFAPPVSPSLPPPLFISLSSSLSLSPPPFLCVSPLYWQTHITLSSSTANVLLSRCRCFVRLSFLLFPPTVFVCLSVLLFVYVSFVCLCACFNFGVCIWACGQNTTNHRKSEISPSPYLSISPSLPFPLFLPTFLPLTPSFSPSLPPSF